MSHNDKHIFVPYKALGFVCNHLPVAVGYFKKRNEPFVVTCVGKAFHTYTCPKLGITNISDSLPSAISVLKVDGSFVYAASGNLVYVFIQWKKVLKVLEGHTSAITHLLPFGHHLVSIDRSLRLKVWCTTQAELYTEMTLQQPPSCLLHPHHYTNKILIAYHDGSMHLFNLLKSKLIYHFKGWNSPITALQQSQAVDIVGVGLKDGHIHLHHLRNDHTLLSFRQQHWGAVTAICFRTDAEHIMMAGSESGHVGVWHLEERRLLSQSLSLHEGPITSLVSINSQSIVVTSSDDNNLKTWVCDTDSSSLRLLNTRSGHHLPPSFIRFHDNHTILSAGLDRGMRTFSTLHESLNKCLGRGRLRKVRRRGGKRVGADDDDDDDVNLLSHVTCFVSQTARQSDWDGIVCCHDDTEVATTWNFNKTSLGRHRLCARSGGGGGGGGGGDKRRHRGVVGHNNSTRMVAECVDVSSCGNFAVVGFSHGVAVKFNMQSGLGRGCYGDEESGHHGRVSGVCVDGLNRRVVTLGWDGRLKLWCFSDRRLLHEVVWQGLVLKKALLCRHNNLLSVARDDFSVVVVDITSSFKLVRVFKQHGNDVTDMAYARSGRWLLTACMDSCIRVFDLVSACLVEQICTPSPATSITISPSNELLASTHVDDLGIYLWSNTRLYHGNEDVSEMGAPDDDVVQMPGTKCAPDDDADDAGDDDDDGKKATHTTEVSLKGDDDDDDDTQVASLVTLAKRGHLKVNSLLHYDLIKERNRAREGVRKDEKAPFFLPTSLLIPLFVTDGVVKQEEEEEEEESHKMLPVLPTKLASLLDECAGPDDDSHSSPAQIQHFKDIQTYLLSLSTGFLDAELKFLMSDSSPNSTHHLSIMLSFLSYWIQTKRHADLANAVVLRMTELNPQPLTSCDLSPLLAGLQAQMHHTRLQHHTTQALLSFVTNTSHFFPPS